MKRTLAILTTALAASLMIGCSTTSPIQNKTSSTLPLDPVSPNASQPRTIQALAQPLTVHDVEAKAGPFLAKLCGMAGTEVRGFAAKRDAVVAMSPMLSGIGAMHKNLIVVEYKGSFTLSPFAGVKPGIKGETYPYAMLVVDAQTGQLVSRLLYAERYRPQ